MDKEDFLIECKNLVNAIPGCEMPNNLTLNQYYDKFNSLKIDRFEEVVEHLKDTSKYKRFPLIFDFQEAIRLTSKENTYDSTGNSDGDELSPEEKTAFFRSLRKKYPAQNRKKEENHLTQTMLHKTMYEKKMVYNIKQGKWITRDEQGKIGGEFVEPQKIKDGL